MAPDLNSLPSSPRPPPSTAPAPTASPPLSRRTSTMGPPPLPPNLSSPGSPRANGDSAHTLVGPGPLRHPRPLTPAELHLELEKEQEAVINRLTRELSLLRQQTASVVSNASSASVSDSMVSTSARRHRSSSSVSTRSISAVTTGTTSVSGVAPARESSMPGSARPSVDLQRPNLSRESSRGPSHRSMAPSPSVQYARQPSGPQVAPPTSDSTYHPRSPSFSTAIAAARYEEAAYHRAELESVKRENEALRQRIKELERAMNSRSSSDDTESRGRPDTTVTRS